jgi:hypothetical protein
MILIGLKIVFIDFSILNIICGLITIMHLSPVPVHIHIICVTECSPYMYYMGWANPVDLTKPTQSNPKKVG